MGPVHNCDTTNELSPRLSDAFLEEKYHIPQGGDFPEALLLARYLEDASQAMDRSEQARDKLFNSITELGESSKMLVAQQSRLTVSIGEPTPS